MQKRQPKKETLIILAITNVSYLLTYILQFQIVHVNNYNYLIVKIT